MPKVTQSKDAVLCQHVCKFLYKVTVILEVLQPVLLPLLHMVISPGGSEATIYIPTAALGPTLAWQMSRVHRQLPYCPDSFKPSFPSSLSFPPALGYKAMGATSEHAS